MFGKKPVITDKFCEQMDQIRLACEVLTGQYARVACIDFNRQRGKILIGSNLFDLTFRIEKYDVSIFSHESLVFNFGQGDCQAGFHKYGVNVCHTTFGSEMWTGRSALERHILQ